MSRSLDARLHPYEIGSPAGVLDQSDRHLGNGRTACSRMNMGPGILENLIEDPKKI